MWQYYQLISLHHRPDPVSSSCLTLDVEPGPGLQSLPLAHGSVPDGAPEAGAVLLLAREDGEDAGGETVSGEGPTLERV